MGGQGNLFFGKVLAQVAFLAGYDDRNILKGETHGMAQMGGPVISTFGCGEVFSPALVPGTANVLIAMEKAEVLRPGLPRSAGTRRDRAHGRYPHPAARPEARSLPFRRGHRRPA